MKKRYKLHWAGQSRLSPNLKWQIWDWTLKCAIAHIESRKLGRLITSLLNKEDYDKNQKRTNQVIPIATATTILDQV